MINDLIEKQQLIQMRDFKQDNYDNTNLDAPETIVIESKKDVEEVKYELHEDLIRDSFILDIIGLAISNLIIYIFPPLAILLNLLFLGKNSTLSYEILEAYGATNLYINVVLYGLILGLSIPFETFGGKAFGKGKLRVLGKYFTICTIFTVIFSFIYVVASIFIGPIIMGLFISSAVTKDLLNKYFTLALIASFVYVNNIPNLRLLVITNKIIPLFIIYIITLCFQIILNLIFVDFLGLGLPGCAYANILGNAILLTQTTIYIRLLKPYPEVLVALQENDSSHFSEYFCNCISSTILIFLSILAFESVGVFLLANYDKDFSAFITLASISSVVLVLGTVFDSTVNIITSENAGIMSKSQLVFNILCPSIIIGNVVIILAIGILVILRFFVNDWFNVNSEIFKIMCDNYWWFIIYIFFQFNVNIFQGLFKGISRIIYPSVLNLLLLLFINIPSAYVLSIFLEWKSYGTWLSLVGTSLINLIILFLSFVVVYNTNDTLKKNE